MARTSLASPTSLDALASAVAQQLGGARLASPAPALRASPATLALASAVAQRLTSPALRASPAPALRASPATLALASAVAQRLTSPAAAASQTVASRLVSAVAARVSSTAPEVGRAITLPSIDPVKLASGIASKLSQVRTQYDETPAALADRLASRIAYKLASPQIMASPSMLSRFNQRVASALMQRVGTVPAEDVDASATK